MTTRRRFLSALGLGLLGAPLTKASLLLVPDRFLEIDLAFVCQVIGTIRGEIERSHGNPRSTMSRKWLPPVVIRRRTEASENSGKKIDLTGADGEAAALCHR
jgi:hypothetical protein